MSLVPITTDWQKLIAYLEAVNNATPRDIRNATMIGNISHAATKANARLTGHRIVVSGRGRNIRWNLERDQ